MVSRKKERKVTFKAVPDFYIMGTLLTQRVDKTSGTLFCGIYAFWTSTDTCSTFLQRF